MDDDFIIFKNTHISTLVGDTTRFSKFKNLVFSFPIFLIDWILYNLSCIVNIH